VFGCRDCFKKHFPIPFFFVFCSTVNGQKTDKVYLINGDILTGEIKSLSLAMLRFDLDGPGIIEIKWEKIKSISSERNFEILLQSGELLVSKIDSNFYSRNSVTVNDFVELYPIRNRFVKRLNGDVSTGLTYTKSSEVLEFRFSGTVNYRVPKLELSLSTNAFITNKSGDSALAKEQAIRQTMFYYFGKFYFTGVGIEWQQNTELGIANRFSVSGYLGQVFIVNNHNRLISYSGLSLNKEQSLGDDMYTTNLELPVIVAYKRFFYSAPKQSIDVTVNAFPSLSDWGRVRLEFSLKTSFELFKDFITGVNFYDKFDNRPPKGADSKNDFGISFTLGYKFNK
jgi:hypothetical protein